MPDINSVYSIGLLEHEVLAIGLVMMVALSSFEYVLGKKLQDEQKAALKTASTVAFIGIPLTIASGIMEQVSHNPYEPFWLLVPLFFMAWWWRSHLKGSNAVDISTFDDVVAGYHDDLAMRVLKDNANITAVELFQRCLQAQADDPALIASAIFKKIGERTPIPIADVVTVVTKFNVSRESINLAIERLTRRSLINDAEGRLSLASLSGDPESNAPRLSGLTKP